MNSNSDKQVPIYKRGDIIIGYAIVDSADYDRAMKYRWTESAMGQVVHGATINYESMAFYMHSFILGTKEPIKHINGNKRDCRRSNLTVVSMSQVQSMRGLSDNNSSGYKGVYWNRRQCKWVAQVKYKDKTKQKSFDDITQAARWYDGQLVMLHGAQAMTNEKLGLL